MKKEIKELSKCSQSVNKCQKREQGKFYFNFIEEVIQNKSFLKKYGDIAGGRIEIWHNDYWYDVEEIRLMLPRKLWNALAEALDMKDVNYFQIGEVRSEDLEKWVKNKLKVEKSKG